MTRNKIYAIVEGHGEAQGPSENEPGAVVVLINKLLKELEFWSLFAAKRPFRMLSYGDFFRGDKLERAIRRHKSHQDCAALLVLLDMDDHCPRDKAFELTKRVKNMEPLPFSVVVVCAKCEYEAWFLASLESIYDGQTCFKDPEAKRDAKGWLKKHFGYRPTRDQSNYTHALDVVLTRERSRSFRRLYHAFEQIVTAAQTGQCIISPLKIASANELNHAPHPK